MLGAIQIDITFTLPHSDDGFSHIEAQSMCLGAVIFTLVCI